VQRFFVFAGTAAVHRFKKTDERIRMVVADPIGDFPHRQIRRSQQILRLLQPLRLDILQRRNLESLFELFVEVGGGQVHQLGQLSHLYFLGKMLLHVVEHGPKPLELPCILEAADFVPGDGENNSQQSEHSLLDLRHLVQGCAGVDRLGVHQGGYFGLKPADFVSNVWRGDIRSLDKVEQLKMVKKSDVQIQPMRNELRLKHVDFIFDIRRDNQSLPGFYLIARIPEVKQQRAVHNLGNKREWLIETMRVLHFKSRGIALQISEIKRIQYRD